MRLQNVIWKNRFVEKLWDKHEVTTGEVEEVLFSRPHVRLAQKGRVKGENLYVACGKSEAGRYLVIFFIDEGKTAGLPISARDMTVSETRYYHDQKEAT